MPVRVSKYTPERCERVDAAQMRAALPDDHREFMRLLTQTITPPLAAGLTIKQITHGGLKWERS